LSYSASSSFLVEPGAAPKDAANGALREPTPEANGGTQPAAAQQRRLAPAQKSAQPPTGRSSPQPAAQPEAVQQRGPASKYDSSQSAASLSSSARAAHVSSPAAAAGCSAQEPAAPAGLALAGAADSFEDVPLNSPRTLSPALPESPPGRGEAGGEAAQLRAQLQRLKRQVVATAAAAEEEQERLQAVRYPYSTMLPRSNSRKGLAGALLFISKC